MYNSAKQGGFIEFHPAKDVSGIFLRTGQTPEKLQNLFAFRALQRNKSQPRDKNNCTSFLGAGLLLRQLRGMQGRQKKERLV